MSLNIASKDEITVVNFYNGINPELTIPANKWGADKILIEGVEYVQE